MARKTKSKAELENLREEAAGLKERSSADKAERQPMAEPAAPEGGAVAAEPGARNEEWRETVAEIEEVIGDLADRAETEITKRPAVAVVAAFALGVVVGRLFSR